jgi:EmrB/QacA subfamily drug resistance transporter
VPESSNPAGPEGITYDPRRWRSLPVVLSATFMSLFDVFVVNVAAPSVQADLHASSAVLQMLVAAYSFTYAAGLVTGARLGDLYGRRRVFAAGLVVFAVASLLCGLAPTSDLLVAGRLLQGVGAAAMVPQVLALLTVTFPAAERPRVFAMFGVTVGLGVVAGQVLGGVLLQADLFGLGWRPIFLVNVPIALTAVVLAYRLLGESRPPVADRLDPLGAVLLSTGIAAVTIPLVLGRTQGWPAWTWQSAVAGVLLLGAFVGWEWLLGRRGGHPLLPLGLFEHRAFNVGLLVNLGFFAFFGSVLLTLTVFLQDGVHDSPLQAGLTFAPLGVAFAVSSVLGRRLQARWGTTTVTAGAATALAGVTGLALLVHAVGTSASALQLSPVLALIGIGNGLVVPLIVAGVLQSVPTVRAGAASGVLTTTQQFSMVLGIAAVGTVFFDRLATDGVVVAMETGLVTDMALVALALLMTLLLPRAASVAPASVPVVAPAPRPAGAARDGGRVPCGEALGTEEVA